MCLLYICCKIAFLNFEIATIESINMPMTFTSILLGIMTIAIRKNLFNAKYNIETFIIEKRLYAIEQSLFANKKRQKYKLIDIIYHI